MNHYDGGAWPSVEPGELRHLIEIQDRSTTSDSFGQPQQIWGTVSTCMAGINIVTMREAFGSNQLTSQSSDIWTARWTPVSIQPGMRIVFRGETFLVQAINNVDKRNVLLHILCLQINAGS